MACPPSRLVLGTGTEAAGTSCNPAAVGPSSADEAPPVPAAGMPVSLKPGAGEGPLEAVPRLPTALPGAVLPAAVGTDGARPMGACCLRGGPATAGPAPLPMPWAPWEASVLARGLAVPAGAAAALAAEEAGKAPPAG